MPNTDRARSIDLENPFAPLTGLCELVMVRHGEQLLTRDTAVGQSVDPPLSELGRRQALAVGERLAHTHLDAIYSSPLRRARDTADAIGGHHGLTPTIVPELHEIEIWSNLDKDVSVRDALPPERVAEIFRDHVRTKKFSAFPDAEDRDLFRKRVGEALHEIINRHLGQRVAVVCHSGVINAFLATILATDQDVPVRIHHTSINVFRGADTRRAVQSINDFRHVLPFQDSVGPYNL